MCTEQVECPSILPAAPFPQKFYQNVSSNRGSGRTAFRCRNQRDFFSKASICQNNPYLPLDAYFYTALLQLLLNPTTSQASHIVHVFQPHSPHFWPHHEWHVPSHFIHEVALVQTEKKHMTCSWNVWMDESPRETLSSLDRFSAFCPSLSPIRHELTPSDLHHHSNVTRSWAAERQTLSQTWHWLLQSCSILVTFEKTEVLSN